MAFWTDQKGGIEPKRAFRWILSIPAGGGTANDTLPSWIVKSVERPTISIAESEHAFLNHTFYYPGRVTYSEVSFVLVDPIDLDAAWRVLKLIEESGYTIPTATNVSTSAGRSTISKKESVEALVQMQLTQVAADGTSLEKWTFINPWIKEVSFSDLSYEDDALTDISVQVRFDRCIYTPNQNQVERTTEKTPLFEG